MVEMLAKATGSAKNAQFLFLDFVPARRASTNPERVMAGPTVGELKIQTEGEMGGMASGPAAHLFDGSAVAKRMVEGCAEGIGDKSKGIKAVAFATAIRTDEKGQRLKIKLREGNALVVPDREAAKEGSGGHGGAKMAGSWTGMQHRSAAIPAEAKWCFACGVKRAKGYGTAMSAGCWWPSASGR